VTKKPTAFHFFLSPLEQRITPQKTPFLGPERNTQKWNFFPWPQSRAAKPREKKDAFEVMGGGGLSNWSAIWSFLDGEGRELHTADWIEVAILWSLLVEQDDLIPIPYLLESRMRSQVFYFQWDTKKN
jgi:hypothetical protein